MNSFILGIMKIGVTKKKLRLPKWIIDLFVCILFKKKMFDKCLLLLLCRFLSKILIRNITSHFNISERKVFIISYCDTISTKRDIFDHFIAFERHQTCYFSSPFFICEHPHYYNREMHIGWIKNCRKSKIVLKQKKTKWRVAFCFI